MKNIYIKRREINSYLVTIIANLLRTKALSGNQNQKIAGYPWLPWLPN